MQRPSGFTLLEVLVAFVILAMSLGAILQIFGNGARGIAASREYADAVLLARTLIDDLAAEAQIEPGTRTGVKEPFQWEVTISPYDVAVMDADQTAIAEIVPVTIRAIVQWGADRSTVELVTLRLVGANYAH